MPPSGASPGRRACLRRWSMQKNSAAANNRKTIEAYIPMVKFIAAVCGPRCEVALHDLDDINHSIALELARNAAVTYGQVLTNAEMENIVNSLFACSNFSYTPDGKKILTILRQTDLEQLFGV